MGENVSKFKAIQKNRENIAGLKTTLSTANFKITIEKL